MSPLRVAILGAGPAGLAAALAMENYAPAEKLEITLIDKNESVSDYEGVEYAIQERGCVALEKIGVKDQVLKSGNPAQAICFYDDVKQKMQARVILKPGYCYEVYRRTFLKDMESMLTRSKVLRKYEVTGLDFKDDGNVVVKTKGDQLEFDCVVAAEGINSPTRKQLFPDVKIIEHDFQIIYLLIDPQPGQEVPNFYTDLANGSNCQFSLGKITTNCYFPLGNNRLAVALSFDTSTHDRIWKDCGLDTNTPFAQIDGDTRKKIAKILAADTTVHDNIFTKLVDLVPDWTHKRIYSWAMRDTDPVSTCYASDGNVVLIGDAAHAMLPCIGQGATKSIEDAEAIGRLIAGFAKTNWKRETLKLDLRSKVFAPFNRARIPVWKDMSFRSRYGVRNFAWQEKCKGLTVVPFVPLLLRPLIWFTEWIRDIFGSR